MVTMWKDGETPGPDNTKVDVTNSTGSFLFAPIAPGKYDLSFIYAQVTGQQGPVEVEAGKTTRITVRLLLHQLGQQNVSVAPRQPLIDTGTTEVGATISSDDARNLPWYRTSGSVATIAPQVVSDLGGLAIAGATFAENRALVDGFDATNPVNGAGPSLPIDFIRSVNVVTGAYEAEYGRALGGQILTTTQSGGADLHGTIFAYASPFAAPANAIVRNDQALAATENLKYGGDVGATLGGPLNDSGTLTYFLGVDYSLRTLSYDRAISSLQDKCNRKGSCNGNISADGIPDTSGNVPLEQGGVTINNQISHQTFSPTAKTLSFVGRFDANPSHDQSGSLILFGNPTTADYFQGFGSENATHLSETTGSEDGVAQWTSKFFDRALILHGLVGLHHETWNLDPATVEGQAVGYRYNGVTSLGDPAFKGFENGAIDVAHGSTCLDNTLKDSYAKIVNCPVNAYSFGGTGVQHDSTIDQIDGRLDGESLFSLLGYHQLKYGVDVIATRLQSKRGFTGGQFNDLWNDLPDATWQTHQFGVLDPSTHTLTPIPAIPSVRGNLLSSTEEQLQPAAFLQDSYTPLPNLAINAGVRADAAYLWGADLPFTANVNEGKSTALTLGPSFAPRVGVVYDPTGIGQMRLFAHVARYYEGVPMGIADQFFSGVGQLDQFHRSSACTNPTDPTTCGVAIASLVRGGLYAQVLPGISAQHEDEGVAGGEVAPIPVLPDLILGGYYTHRTLGNPLEVLTVDGGTNTFLGNRDHLPSATQLATQGDSLARQASATTDPQQQAVLEAQAASLKALAARYGSVASLPPAQRVYDAVTVTARKSFDRDWFVIASYTLSRAYGNYPGVTSDPSSLLDPSATTYLVSPDLAANRTGLLPQNHTSSLKADGYYLIDLGSNGYVLAGATIRWLTGAPYTAMAASPIYGQEQTFLGPRGAAGSTANIYELDGHATYGRSLGHGMTIEAYLDLLNLVDLQATTAVDQAYTTDPALPIVGATTADLPYAKQIDPAAYALDPMHAEIPVPGQPGAARLTTRNFDFGSPVARQMPFATRVGVRLLF
jgi:hypothetical protein